MSACLCACCRCISPECAFLRRLQTVECAFLRRLQTVAPLALNIEHVMPKSSKICKHKIISICGLTNRAIRAESI